MKKTNITDSELKRIHTNELAKARVRRFRARLKEMSKPKVCVTCGTPLTDKPHGRATLCDKCIKKRDVEQRHNSYLRKRNRDTYKKYYLEDEKDIEIKRLKRQVRYYKKRCSLTFEEKEQQKAKRKRWLINNPDKSKAIIQRHKRTEKYFLSQKRFLEKDLETKYNNQTNIKFKTEADRNKYNLLSRLLARGVIPNRCEICDATRNLQIHHKQYDYPILLVNLQRLCKACHDHSHHPEGELLNKKEKEKIRARHRILLKDIKSCQICGAVESEDIWLEVHHYRYDDSPNSYIKVCRLCHHRLGHHHDPRIQQVEEVKDNLKS